MSTAEIIGATFGTICFLIWILCIISWVRRGISIPRYIHLLAVVMTCVGVGCLIGMTLGGLLTLKLAFSLIVLPPALTYFGWFWMFGPELTQ